MERRTFLGPDIDIAALADALAAMFTGEGYEIQVVRGANSASVVQARKQDALSRYTGISPALTVVMSREGDFVAVEAGTAQWMDRGVAAGAGHSAVPSFVTAGIGAFEHHHLNREAWQFVEEYVRRHSRQPLAVRSNGLKPAPKTTVCANPSCGQPLPAGSRFCPACGTAVHKTCMNCGQELEAGALRCTRCGSAVSA